MVPVTVGMVVVLACNPCSAEYSNTELCTPRGTEKVEGMTLAQ